MYKKSLASLAFGGLLAVLLAPEVASAYDADTYRHMELASAWGDPDTTKSWGRGGLDGKSVSRIDVRTMPLPALNKSYEAEPYAVLTVVNQSTPKILAASASAIEVAFTNQVTENRTVTRDERKCTNVTKRVEKTKWFRGKRKIQKAKVNGWKRVKGVKSDPMLGKQFRRFVSKTSPECVTVKVTETKPVKVDKGVTFTTRYSLGQITAEDFTENGTIKTCSRRWTAGIRPESQDYKFDRAAFPSACIGTGAYDVTYKVTIDGASASYSLDDKISFSPITKYRTASGVHAVTLRTSGTVASERIVAWSGTATNTLRYDHSARMVYATQQYRGRAPDGTKPYDVAWHFYDGKSVPVDPEWKNFLYMTARRSGSNWTVSGGGSGLLGLQGDNARKWACNVESIVDASMSADTFTLAIPVECFGGIQTMRGLYAGGFGPMNTPVQPTPVSQAIVLS